MLFSSAIDSAIDPSCVSSCATSQVISSDSRVAARGDRHFDKRQRRKSCVRWGKWVLALVVLCLSALVGFAPSAEAQTAHFSWAMTTLGSGFTSPQAVAVDASGNVFVADSSSSTVKEIVAASGYITINTLGNGFSSPAGIAVDASGNVFVADTGNNAVKEILVGGTITTLGSFSSPKGVAIDASGNVFVADTGNSAVKEILVGGTINTLGGGFSFSSPTGVAVDASGNVFVADTGNNAVNEILTGGTVNTLGGGFSFSSPTGVALDANGNVFVADSGSAVKEILATGYTIVNTLGSGFSQPGGVAVDASGNIFVADSGNSAVKEIVTRGVNFGAAAINNTGTPPQIQLTFTFDTTGTIGTPAVMTQGAAGLDFTDAGTGSCTTNGTVHSYIAGDTCTLNVSFTPKFSGVRYGAATLSNSLGAVIATAYVYGTGSGPQVTFSPGTPSSLGGGFSQPQGVAVDGNGNVFVADTTVVKEIPVGCGNTSCVVTLAGSFTFNNLPGIAVDGSGNVFVADYGASKVYEILATGGYITVNTLGGSFSFSSPTGVALDGSGNVFVADTNNSAVEEILAAGGYTTVNTLGGGFSHPQDVAVDGKGNVYVADTNNSAVKEIPSGCGSAGCVVTLGGGFNQPVGVMVDGNGNIYIGDTNSNAVKQMSASCASASCVVTLDSSFNHPQGVAVDGSGNVYVADSGNTAVKELDFADPPSLNFTSTAVGATSSDSPQTVTVTNIGNAALTFPVPATGLNPSIAAGFTLGGSTCPQLTSTSSAGTLAPGAFCTNSISFTPTAIGPSGGSLAITDDHLNAGAPIYATQSIALSGTATVGTPTISFTVPNHTYGDAAFTVSATSNSTGTFTYTVVSGPATLSGSTVTLTGAGTVVLQASEAADTNYTTATQNASFTVAATTPTISFTVPNHTYGDAAFTVSATSNSTGAFTYTVVSGPATISGSTVTLTGAGTVVLQTSEAADTNYTVATQNASFTVAATTPTIGFTVPNHTYGDAAFTVSATSNSTGAFTYTVVSGPATISGSTITLTGAGTVVLQTSEAADTNYTANTQNASFTIAAGTPTISFTVPNHTYGDAAFTVSATSNSTGASTYTVLSGSATISGSTVTLTGAGTVVLQASQAADANYVAATQNATFAVAAGTPTISFTIPNHTYGDAAFTVSATSTATGAFTYTVVSGPATVSGSTVTLTGAGTVVLQTSEAADTNYTASTQNVTFTVAATTPTISFTVPNHTYGDAAFTVSATSNSTGAFTYTVVSGPATISGSTVTLTGVGTVVLEASEASDNNYTAATKNATFTVAATTPTISFTVPNHTYGDAAFTVSATSNSTGAFTYTVVSGPATITGSTITLTGVGTVVLQASQAADANYVAATQNATFTVATISPTISFTVPNHIYGDAPFTVSATSNSTGAFTYSVVSGPATIAGSTVTLTGAGTVVLQASQAADANYVAATQNATFTVAGITPTISFTVPNHTYGDTPFTVSAVSKSTGAFTYTVVSGPATIAGSIVTLTGTGTVALQASQAADANYLAATQNTTFTVATATPTIAFTVANHTFGDAPFTVSATSTSTGAFTYAVVSGPATIAGSTVTLTGTGTIVLSASQAASGNYAPATTTTSFTVAAGFTFASGSGTGSTSGTATVAPGAAATFTLTLSPAGAATYPDALTLSAAGLPTGATATFSPATIQAGSAVTPVTLTIQTSTQTARNEKPSSGRPFAPVALGFLLLPLAGMKAVRRRLRQMPSLTVALAVVVLSLGALLGLSGCGGSSAANQTAKSYTVVVTATDASTGAHTSTNVTLNVQ
jgi:streptogramin lyase